MATNPLLYAELTVMRSLPFSGGIAKQPSLAGRDRTVVPEWNDLYRQSEKYGVGIDAMPEKPQASLRVEAVFAIDINHNWGVSARPMTSLCGSTASFSERLGQWRGTAIESVRLGNLDGKEA